MCESVGNADLLPAHALPPLVSEGGELVCESVGSADLLPAHFDGKQSREAVDQPRTCRLSPSLATSAIRSKQVRCLFLDLDSYGGTNLLGMFPLFLKRGDVLMLWPSVLVQCFGGGFV